DIEKIGSSIPPLNKALDALPSHHTLSDGITIRSDLSSLGDALKKASNDLKAVHSLSSSDSQTLFKTANSWLPQVEHLLANVVDHKADIGKINFPGIYGLVESTLEDLRDDHDNFCNNLADASTDDVKDQIKTRKAKNDVAFDKAEKAFST
ncbi:hypothetical protein H0H93_006075, partial [Arthromyces matolae]